MYTAVAETVAPGQPVERGGRAASRFTERNFEGRKVQLEFDVERLDQYGRTLAYVWVGDTLFNEVLIANGFAAVTTSPPNVKYVDRFLAAQRSARATNLGLWAHVHVTVRRTVSSPGATVHRDVARDPPRRGPNGWT